MKITVKIFLSVLFLLPFAGGAYAAPVLESTSRDQKSLDLTVYSDQFAMVREVRRLDLPAGQSTVKFSDVPASITPETIQIRSLTSAAEFSVWEQNYERNTFDAQGLLEKFVGKKIKLMNWNQFQDRKDVTEATLLSNDGEPVYQIGNEIYIGHPGTRILPEVPAEMAAKPAFIWLVDAASKKAHDLEVSYLAGSMGWRADYVLALPEISGTADLGAWVTLNNQSGAAYPGARLKLIAGQVNSRRPQPMGRNFGMKAQAMMADAAPEFSEKTSFEYHAYELPRPVTLLQNQTKQVPLFKNKTGVKFLKEYRVDGAPYYYGNQSQENQKQPVQVFVRIMNAPESGLGVPLPQGTVRIYSRDAQGRLTFLGEDGISHTAQGEELRVAAGEAFDIIAERKQLDFKQVTSNTTETEWEIKIKNRKAEDLEVNVFETLSGSWQILTQSQPSEKINAGLVKFRVKAPKNSETTVRYRVRTGF